MSNNYMSYKGECEIMPQNNPKIKQSTCTNSGFNFGNSSRLQYDQTYLNDRDEQSTAPLASMLDPNRVKNCNQCLSLNGPRPSHNGWGDSLPIKNPGLTPAQQLTDIDSIMSNRNVKKSRDKQGGVNPVDLDKFKMYDASTCGYGLAPLSSLLTYPKQLGRETSINRFYDLNINPQKNIYWSWTTNSQLEARDNYRTPYPYGLGLKETSESLPQVREGFEPNVPVHYNVGCTVPTFDARTYPKVNTKINPDFIENQRAVGYQTESDDEM